jgi:hypothetical protein
MGFFSNLFGSKKANVVNSVVNSATPSSPVVPPPPAAPEPPAPSETPAAPSAEEDKAAKKAAKKAAQAERDNAMLAQAHQQMDQKRAEAVQADPGLTVPFEGITVEMWAQAASAMITHQDVTKQAQELAKIGMDRAQYERANSEFQSRMQRDTTGAIATIYGQAFSASQNVGTGDEPVSFDKYAEIAGAQAAWGEMGADVIGNLKKFFDITALDVSNYGSYWMTKMMTDMAMMEKHSKLSEKYKAKYKTGGDLDEDLDI